MGRPASLSRASPIGPPTWKCLLCRRAESEPKPTCEKLIHALLINLRKIYQQRRYLEGTVRKLDDATIQILSNSTIDGAVLTLPPQLDRATYVKVDKVLKSLGGKWNRKRGGHVFDSDPRDLVRKSVEDGSYRDRKRDAQMFWTPCDLARRMIDRAEVQPGDRVLEPSAGSGRLVTPLLELGARVTAVEIDPDNAQLLRAIRDDCLLTVCTGDFLVVAERLVDFQAVVMNPPFAKNQDVEHILTAWGCLAAGGRLVAICGAGALFRSDRKARRFQTWLSEIDADVEELPSGTFRKSGTDAATALIVATKSDG